MKGLKTRVFVMKCFFVLLLFLILFSIAACTAKKGPINAGRSTTSDGAHPDGTDLHEQETGESAPRVQTTGEMSFKTEGENMYRGDNMYAKERIVFSASDGVQLVANYYDAPGRNGLILIHQFNLNKESWDGFARLMQKRGYASIAVDLRGHGESDGDVESFTPRDFQAMLFDVQAAAAQLRSRNKSVLLLLGASIGANTAFRYSSLESVPAVLLSPGLDYKGIDINTVTSTAPTLIIVGSGDKYSFSSAKELDENNLLGEHELMVVDSSRHGTYLLEDQRVVDRILSFIDRQAGLENAPTRN